MPWWLAAAVIIATTAVPVGGQLQQSGGGGSAIATWGGGTLGAMANYGTSPGAVLTPGVNAFVTNTPAVSQSGTWTVGLSTGTNVIGKTVPATACGTTVASQALAAVPTTSTAVFSSTTCLTAIVLNNTNASAVTVTVSDNQATPINDILTFSLPANSQIIQPLWGVAFTTGMKWSASTTGVTGAAIGYQ